MFALPAAAFALAPATIRGADGVFRGAIAEKKKIHARRELRDITEEQANDMIEVMDSFLADTVDMIHHLKKLSKIENNPNGYYTQQYRHIYGCIARA